MTDEFAWGITDDKGHLFWGGSQERAAHVLWEMQNDDAQWVDTPLRLVYLNRSEFDKPRPWFPKKAGDGQVVGHIEKQTKKES